MKRYSRIFNYLKDYKTSMVKYIFTILLSIIFSVLSLAMLFPFLQLLFGASADTSTKKSSNVIMSWVNNYLSELLKNGDVFFALSMVCVLIVISIFLKNLFLYLSMRTLGPVKNKITNTVDNKSNEIPNKHLLFKKPDLRFLKSRNEKLLLEI